MKQKNDDLDRDLGTVEPAFAGFKLHQGQIITPNGYAYPPEYLYAIPIQQQPIAELQRQLRLERRTPRQLLL